MPESFPIIADTQIVHEQRVETVAGRRVLARFPAASRVDYRSFVTTMSREIDTRPCDPLTTADAEWGEQDSLANIPRPTQPSWVKLATTTPDQEGDR